MSAKMREFKMLLGLATFMMGCCHPTLPEPSEPLKPKTPETPRKYISIFGFGKKVFIFETKYGIVKICSDNQNAASKHLRKVNGENAEICQQRQ